MTEQLAEAPLPESVQLVGRKVPPLFVKLTVPVGVVGEAVVSVTVAVHVVGLPTATVAGVQLTLVLVVRLTVTVVVPELVACVVSPP